MTENQVLTDLSNTEMAEGDQLSAVNKKLAYITTTVYATAQRVDAIAKHFDMIIAGLMASPIGPALRKTMEQSNGH